MGFEILWIKVNPTLKDGLSMHTQLSENPYHYPWMAMWGPGWWYSQSKSSLFPTLGIRIKSQLPAPRCQCGSKPGDTNSNVRNSGRKNDLYWTPTMGKVFWELLWFEYEIFPPRLMCLSTWSRLRMLCERVVEPSGGGGKSGWALGADLEVLCHGFTSCSFCLCNMTSWLPDPTTMHSLPRWKASYQTVTQKKHFFLNLTVVGYFIIAIRKLT